MKGDMCVTGVKQGVRSILGGHCRCSNYKRTSCCLGVKDNISIG